MNAFVLAAIGMLVGVVPCLIVAWDTTGPASTTKITVSQVCATTAVQPDWTAMARPTSTGATVASGVT